MALIYPYGWKELAVSGAAVREIETLTLLEKSLPDDYRIYHGVHWTRVKGNYAIIGEIDFAVLSPSGKLLLIEQKSGFLTETAEGLVKTYNNKPKPIPFQMQRSLESMRARLVAHAKGTPLMLESLLYCPDYTVKAPGTAGIDPARIVDASRNTLLPQIISQLLPLDAPPSPLANTLHAFLCDILDLTPDASAFAGQAQTLYTRLAGGLAEWAQNIEFEPFRLHVIGTAGSGKTQLAISVFNRALSSGKRPLYICFNRPLADHFALCAAPGGISATYHHFCDMLYRQSGLTPDFSNSAMFDDFEAFLDSYLPTEADLFDVLIIDEGQDFKPAWRDNLLRFLREDGKAWWLEDPMQKLYKAPDVELPGWVVLRSEINYRTPRDILNELGQLISLPCNFSAGSPITGSPPTIHTYRDSSEMMEKTCQAIRQALDKGYRRDMIALISFAGRKNSLLANYDRLGPIPLRQFTGQYDDHGNPIYSDGEVLLESVYRFKGQAAPCVILTEIDFEIADEISLRKLFVGATRATLDLTLVLSERAAHALLTRST